MSLIVVRHGQTAANRSGLLLGRADPPLTEFGQRQAESVAAVVTGAIRVVSSPLLRARQTAETFGLPVTIDDRWTEIDYGELDESPLTEIPSELWSRWRKESGFSPPGGESLDAVLDRVRAACADLVEEALVNDIVVVSHVSPIKASVAWALDVGIGIAWRMYLEVASITRIGITDRGPSLTAFNERAHLPR